jgi:hypothetical protein
MMEGYRYYDAACEAMATAITGAIMALHRHRVSATGFNKNAKKFTVSSDMYNHLMEHSRFQPYFGLRNMAPEYPVGSTYNGSFYGLPLEVNPHLPQNTFMLVAQDDVQGMFIHPLDYDLDSIRRAYRRSNLTIIVKSRADIERGFEENERCALETLREMISESEYRKYIKYGFILVQGKSGRIYQIFRRAHHIKVWEKGILVEELCIYLKDPKIPKTDKVIALKTIIEISEEEARKLSNVYPMLKKVA